MTGSRPHRTRLWLWLWLRSPTIAPSRSGPLYLRHIVHGCGRCNLPGADSEQMFQSLQRLKTEIPDDITLFPSHHYAAVATSTMAE